MTPNNTAPTVLVSQNREIKIGVEFNLKRLNSMSAIEFNRSITGMYGSLKPYAVKLTRSLEDANDLLQETILKALTNRDKYRHNTNLKAWLYTIMRNIFINNYRKKVRQNTIFDNTDQSEILGIIVGLIKSPGLKEIIGIDRLKTSVHTDGMK